MVMMLLHFQRQQHSTEEGFLAWVSRKTSELRALKDKKKQAKQNCGGRSLTDRRNSKCKSPLQAGAWHHKTKRPVWIKQSEHEKEAVIHRASTPRRGAQPSHLHFKRIIFTLQGVER